MVRQGQQKTSHQLSSINFSRISSVKKWDGSSYEPNSVTSLQRSLEQHLRDDLGKQSSILQDCEFALSWEAIVASRKKFKEEGREKEISPMRWNLLKVKTLNAFGSVEHLVRETQKHCRTVSGWCCVCIWGWGVESTIYDAYMTLNCAFDSKLMQF